MLASNAKVLVKLPSEAINAKTQNLIYLVCIMMIPFLLTLICMIPLISHPLVLGLGVLGVASVVSVFICKLIISWFGYSLFLVYVGGVLVMFSYVVVLSPNLIGVNVFYFTGLGRCLFLVNSVLCLV